MIDHTTGSHPHDCGRSATRATTINVGDGGLRPRAPEHAERCALAPNGDIYIADMHHQRVRRSSADAHHLDRCRQRALGQHGRRRPADRATLAGPAGVAWSRDPWQAHAVHCRLLQRPRPAVGPDGIIRE
jgi:hypothetical protein